MKTLKDLEKASALQILDFLYENGESLRYQIEDTIQGSSGTIGSSLVVLGELGLLEERREPPYKRYIGLSPKGKEVGYHLNEIKKQISEC